MSPNTSNLSHDRHSREVTQQSHTIDHAPRLNRFSLGIFSTIAPARLVTASIPTESHQITRHGDSQAPAFNAKILMIQCIYAVPLETLHNTTPELAPIATWERAVKAGGEGVQGSPPFQSSQSISPRRKF